MAEGWSRGIPSSGARRFDNKFGSRFLLVLFLLELCELKNKTCAHEGLKGVRAHLALERGRPREGLGKYQEISGA